jgi:hypothetical protein
MHAARLCWDPTSRTPPRAAPLKGAARQVARTPRAACAKVQTKQLLNITGLTKGPILKQRLRLRNRVARKIVGHTCRFGGRKSSRPPQSHLQAAPLILRSDAVAWAASPRARSARPHTGRRSGSMGSKFYGVGNTTYCYTSWGRQRMRAANPATDSAVQNVYACCE